LSAFSALGAPSLPDDAIAVMRQAGWKAGVRISVITSADGLVKLGVLLPDPDAIVLDKLCALGGGSSSTIQSFGRFLDILSKDSAPDVAGTHFVEFLMQVSPYDYNVYKPGFDVMFHFNVRTLSLSLSLSSFVCFWKCKSNPCPFFIICVVGSRMAILIYYLFV